MRFFAFGSPRNIRLYQPRQISQRFLPTKITTVWRNHSRDTALRNVNFHANGDWLDRHTRRHLASKIRPINRLGCSQRAKASGCVKARHIFSGVLVKTRCNCTLLLMIYSRVHNELTIWNRATR